MKVNLKLATTTILVLFVFSCAGSYKLNTYIKPGVKISKSEPIAVISSRMGNEDALILPEVISTELLGQGLNVIDRSVLMQRVKEKGLDLSIILNDQEYLKLGTTTDVNQLVVVTSQLFKNTLVKNATVKVIDTKTGTVLFSSSFHNPAPTSLEYVKNLDLMEIAKLFAEAIGRESY